MATLSVDTQRVIDGLACGDVGRVVGLRDAFAEKAQELGLKEGKAIRPTAGCVDCPLNLRNLFRWLGALSNDSPDVELKKFQALYGGILSMSRKAAKSAQRIRARSAKEAKALGMQTEDDEVAEKKARQVKLGDAQEFKAPVARQQKT